MRSKEDIKKLLDYLKQKEGKASNWKKFTKVLSRKSKYKNTRVKGSSDYGLYYDDQGYLTAGHGHLVTKKDMANPKRMEYLKNLSSKEAINLLEKDSRSKINKIDKDIPNLREMTIESQIPLISSYFRGGLSGSRKTKQLIKDKEYGMAAREFLDNEEYRRRKKNKRDGVVPRMEAVSNALNTLEEAKINTQRFMENESPEARLIGSTEEEDITIMERLLNRSRKE